MGISGLLPLLKSIQKSAHIKSFAGQTVAIDAYGWLHRGTIACAVDLALERPTRRWVRAVTYLFNPIDCVRLTMFSPQIYRLHPWPCSNAQTLWCHTVPGFWWRLSARKSWHRGRTGKVNDHIMISCYFEAFEYISANHNNDDIGGEH